ncbi:hypothetical protein ACFFJB_00055, partial [Camelimonas abortus]|uniref:hypothetical protein n=1 Tax=Camelimonas abortus TaxID=1017184 RepID=UPI0035EBA619
CKKKFRQNSRTSPNYPARTVAWPSHPPGRTTHEQHAIRTELADALERLHKLERRHDEEICALSERAQRLEDRFRELELKCHTERILTLESQHILERDRLDWALGLLEGLAEELQKYQFARQDPTYWDAYAKASRWFPSASRRQIAPRYWLSVL